MEVPELVEIVERAAVKITWADGTEDLLDADTLRNACSCADCLAPRERPSLRLTVISSGATIENARLVGDYGVSLVFGPDGHRTGIFRWDHLARLAGRPVTDSADRSDTSR